MSKLADAVLFVHFAFVAFVVGGLAGIWLGATMHWQWVRNFWFRAAHLAAICFVAAEALSGVACPLTLWEDALRGTASDTSFVARWVHRVMFYSFPDWVFTAAYALFAAVVALTLWLVPPARRRSQMTKGRSRTPYGPKQHGC
jgi:hypothetical protein